MYPVGHTGFTPETVFFVVPFIQVIVALPEVGAATFPGEDLFGGLAGKVLVPAPADFVQPSSFTFTVGGVLSNTKLSA